MAIVKIPGKEALRHRKNNKAAVWGNRAVANRVEPIAAPAFDVPFQLQPREKIYTIGSCFARNVETALLAKGFALPMRELFRTPAFTGLDLEIVNNFGTPSIYNEIAWAFEEERFDEKQAFLELAPDKYTDLHMVSSLRPAPCDALRARRSGLFEATRSLADCRVIIMTLGLVEIWWDEETQLYLNTQPPRAVMRKSPDRFSLHVLDVEQCLDYLERALAIIFRHGRSDLQIVLTVSPVPMMGTHRPVDVMAANTYSKSALRVVAEYIVTRHPQITYFPSYESVTLSDRRLAWMDDLVHVRDEMIAFNVNRMVDAFTGGGNGAEIALPVEQARSALDVEASFLAEKARHARARGDAAFFEKHDGTGRLSAAFAIQHAHFLRDRKAYAEALETLKPHDGVEARLLTAQCLFDAGDYAAAAKRAMEICAAGHKGMPQWRLLLRAIVKRGASLEELEAIETDWLAAARGARHIVQLHSGVAMRNAGFPEAGLKRLESAAENPNAPTIAAIEYARCLVAAGNPREAIALLRECVPDNAIQRRAIRSVIAQAKEESSRLES